MPIGHHQRIRLWLMGSILIDSSEKIQIEKTSICTEESITISASEECLEFRENVDLDVYDWLDHEIGRRRKFNITISYDLLERMYKRATEFLEDK